MKFNPIPTMHLEKFARFIAVALKSGRAAIVLITESHREGLVSRLKAQGIDVSASTHIIDHKCGERFVDI
jgi:hypothetical protein